MTALSSSCRTKSASSISGRRYKFIIPLLFCLFAISASAQNPIDESMRDMDIKVFNSELQMNRYTAARKAMISKKASKKESTDMRQAPGGNLSTARRSALSPYEPTIEDLERQIRSIGSKIELALSQPESFSQADIDKMNEVLKRKEEQLSSLMNEDD